MPNSRQFVESLSRGFKLLSVVCKSRSALSLTELAKESNLSISTIQRLSFTLQQLELLDRDPKTKRFRIGPKMITLALEVTNKLELKKIARPFMQDASDRIGEVVGLGELSGDQIILTEIIRTNQVLDINMNAGAIIPPHAASLAKAILAFISETEMKAILDKTELTPFTKNTIISITAYEEQLKEIRRLGYAIAVEENVYGFSAIAAPIRGNHGKVIASVAIMVPSFRISKQKLIGSFRKEVLETAGKISYAMGYRDNNMESFI